MRETETIALVDTPVTQTSITENLRALGVRRGDTLIVHSAMSKLGWVCGREMAVIGALIEAVGSTGLIVMPAHSSDNSEPAEWSRPPVPQSWHPMIRSQMPAYDRRTTATRAMGRIAESFRTWPGTRRSAHPHVSWCARGLGAAWLLRGHSYHKPGFGMQSPLGRLYARNAKILLMGVGYGNCTALHMAEALCPGRATEAQGASVKRRGMQHWAQWNEIAMDSDRFPQIGEAYEQDGGDVLQGKIGAADCKVLRVRPLVDYATRWLTEHPPAEE